MGARRAGTTAVIVVATTLLVVVLVTWASSIGPSNVLRGKGMGPIGSSPSASTTADAPVDNGVTHPVIHEHAWVRELASILDLVLIVVAAVLLVRYVLVPLARRVRARRQRRRAAAAELERPDFEVLEPPQRAARAILDDAPGQRRLLLEGGSPRNAVVECWNRFEVAAARAGLARRPWETSSEYTIRVLDLVDAYEPAVSRLAELYREARFSEHDLTEADRAAALEALDTIHRTIGVPA